MKIVMFTNTYLPHVGGVARSVDLFAKDLRRMGHRVMVVAPHFETESDDDENVLRVPAIQNFNGSDFSVPILLPLTVANEIQTFKPEIIHSHHPFLMGNTALRMARKYDLPLIFTHHTMYDQYTHYVPLDSGLLRRFIENMVTLYTDFCDRMVAPSLSVAAILQSRGVTSPIVDIPTGVDTRFFAKGDGGDFRQKHGIPRNAEVIGHLGRLAPEKNLAYLARAIAAYMHNRPQVYFLVVGDGPSEQEIFYSFQNAGAGHRLVMAGQKRGKAVAQAYRAMDLFVFASQTETQGMVLLEAMAAGVPVIALDAPGSREVVKDDTNGRLLPADTSADGFANAVDGFFKDNRKQKRWKDGAAGTARLYSREFCARRMADLYGTVLDHRRPRSTADDEIIAALDAVVQRIKTEWDLLTQKTQAAAEAIQFNRQASTGNRPEFADRN